MFSLDYRTICQTLQRMRYTGLVEATIPSGVFAKGTVILEVQTGVIQTCMVVTSKGQRVTNLKQITEQLARIDLFEWRLLARAGSSDSVGEQTFPYFASAQEPGPLIFSGEAQPRLTPLYPQRLDSDPAWVSTWPLIYRQVYNLSTGQYSEQDIARLLHYSPIDLLHVFTELENMGVLKRQK